MCFALYLKHVENITIGAKRESTWVRKHAHDIFKKLYQSITINVEKVFVAMYFLLLIDITMMETNKENNSIICGEGEEGLLKIVGKKIYLGSDQTRAHILCGC